MMDLEKNLILPDIQVLRMIINGCNVLPVSLTVVYNLFYMIQNRPMLKINKFQQLIADLFFKSDNYFDLCNLYDINIHYV